MLKTLPHPPDLKTCLKTLVCAIALNVGVAGHALAQTPTDAAANFRFSGFGSIGFTHADADGATFVRDITQPQGAGNHGLHWEQDTRLGVQGNLQLTDNLEAVAQIVSRYRQENNFDPEVTWGFLKYNHNDWLEVRAGRIGFDVYPGADTRDVGYSYLWVRPPIEYFGTLLFPYEDGGDIMVRQSIGNGLIRAKLYTGITRQRVNSLMQQREWLGGLNLPPIGTVQDLNKSRVSGGFIEYQDIHWTARIGMANLDTKKEMPDNFGFGQILQGEIMQAMMGGNLPLAGALQAFGNDARLADKQSTFKAINLAYEDGPLQTQLAFSRIDSDSAIVPDYKSAYISAGYRFGKLTPYLAAARISTKHNDTPERLAQLGATPAITTMSRFMLNTGVMNRHSVSIGARYDIAQNLALKMQMDVVHNKSCSPLSLPFMSPGAPCPAPLMWPKVPVDWDGRAKIYSAVLDFTF